ncbi:ribonuclease H-like domain-containing protein [Mycena alexandri]|uniref:Ribonuclease H-like domain-containing protein n=1 Tax=Mycena alexandri TaxID=1745969 RepID=A0AAD6RW59_9AGAR|nr:ribonuclease H-like domain-containing protein [Mycena alexandri]
MLYQYSDTNRTPYLRRQHRRQDNSSTNKIKTNSTRIQPLPQADHTKEPAKEDGNPATTLKKTRATTSNPREHQVNSSLAKIQEGVVGFDTEFVKRRPTIQEHVIVQSFPNGGSARRTALLGWQLVELHTSKRFPIAWDKIGLRLIQISQGDEAWVIDVWKIRAFPKELRRIMMSPLIAKAGCRSGERYARHMGRLPYGDVNLVDVGLMARLTMAEKFPKVAYANLSMERREGSDWSASELTNYQKNYAALDAVAALKLYQTLVPTLMAKSISINSPIPRGWYTFNTKHGDPMRISKALDGSDILWKASDCNWWAAGKFVGYP